MKNLKNLLIKFLLSAFVITLYSTSLNLQAGYVRVVVNNTPITFVEMRPFMFYGHVMLPLNAVAEAMGYEVSLDEYTQAVTLTRGNRTAEITIGSPRITTIEMPYGYRLINYPDSVLPQLIGGKIVVPLSAISLATGAGVRWDESTRTASILTPAFLGDYQSDFEFTYHHRGETILLNWSSEFNIKAITTAEELENFLKSQIEPLEEWLEVADPFNGPSPDRINDRIDRFISLYEEYTESFFDDFFLILITFTERDDRTRNNIRGINKNGDIVITRMIINDPRSSTPWGLGWSMVVEVERGDIAIPNNFDIKFVDTFHWSADTIAWLYQQGITDRQGMTHRHGRRPSATATLAPAP